MSDVLIGPFSSGERYALVVGGYVVPNLYATKQQDGRYLLHLERDGGAFFGTESVSEEEIGRWLPLLANAMATSAGYSCHGENSQPRNPYRCRVTALGEGEDGESTN